MKQNSTRSKEKQNTSLQPGSIGTEDKGHFLVDFHLWRISRRQEAFSSFLTFLPAPYIQKYQRSLLPVTEILPLLR